ncbi:hypothetical protein C464_05098 [Halorubrum coriense DSM 10284]|uniref:DUF4013 domain-containing protein n=1 Tax=Halorubrum coriense DSM 10284 TaxID=1227466 RepID=M0EQU9_9EURY|nr:DUF4013 domain-containing protein [Halorubrum coriense]ELZ49277.1 hypothetical protein C464_05098 [Halorubrum coriense DSM 10284]
MLTAAATALAQTDDTAGVVLVGGAVTLLAWVLTPLWLLGVLFVTPAVAVAAPVALAPSLVARGYFVRVTRSAIQSGDAGGAPSLVAWGELVRDGVKSAALSAALLAPLAGGFAVASGVVAALVAGPVDPGATAAAVESALGPSGPTAVAVAAAGVGVAFAGAYLLAFAYVRPAALAAFAASGRLRDGLNPRTVADVAATGPYATAWTLGVGALAVGYAVAVPTAPLVVGVALAFLVRVVAHGLYGRGAARAMAEGSEDRGETGPAVGAARADTRAATTRPGGRATGVAGAARGADAAHRADASRGRTARGAATVEGDRAPDGPPVRLVSGDGGRPMRSEPPAAVQVGRAVPVDGGGGDVEGDASDVGDAADTARADDVNDTDDATADPKPDAAARDDGFEWGPTLDEAEDKG